MSRIAAGLRNKRVVFQRNTPTIDDQGGEVDSWADIGAERAQVLFGTGQERREAAQEQASTTASFRVLHNSLTSGLTTRDRISFDGAYWDITSNVPFGRGLNENREITAVRAS